MLELDPPKCVLLVSNSRDFTTDYVVAELRARGIRYLRLDMDLLAQDSVSLDPSGPTLEARTPQGHFFLTAEDICGIHFRAPTHLSESGQSRYNPEEQLSRHQWAAFVRALTVFETASWVNHPVHTYAAESKPYQLYKAIKMGWIIPSTRITNNPPENHWPPSGSGLVVKSLDSFLARIEGKDVFFYTHFVNREELTIGALHAMPAILQSGLSRKVDLRVTVIGDQCMAAAILRSGEGVEGDWRLQKDGLDYDSYELPVDVRQRCINTVRAFGLVFGALDLAYSGSQYYFLELNPTGEWAWLHEQLGFPIPQLLADAICGKPRLG